MNMITLLVCAVCINACLSFIQLFFFNLLSLYLFPKYENNDEVVLWMNTVGPFPNRQETYSYFSLPFCHGPKGGISHYHETLGEALQGVELEFSGLQIEFKGKPGGDVDPLTRF